MSPEWTCERSGVPDGPRPLPRKRVSGQAGGAIWRRIVERPRPTSAGPANLKLVNTLYCGRVDFNYVA